MRLRLLAVADSKQTATHLHCCSFKRAISCPAIAAALWFVSMCSFQSLLLLQCWLYVSVFLCFFRVYVSISAPSCQCPTAVCLRAARLGSHHSYGGERRCLCHSLSHQSDCSQLRQSPSVLLPLYWPKLSAGQQVRADMGPDSSDQKKNCIQRTASHLQQSQNLSTTSRPLRALPICPHHLLHVSSWYASWCAPLTLHKNLCFSLLPLPGVTNIWSYRLFYQNTQIWSRHLWGRGGLSHKWTWWILSFIPQPMPLWDTSAHDVPTLPSNGIKWLWHAYCTLTVRRASPLNNDARFNLKRRLHLSVFCFLCFFCDVFHGLSSSFLFSLCLFCFSILCSCLCFWLVPCRFPREEGEDEGAHQFCCSASGCSSPSSRWAEVWPTVRRLTGAFTCEKPVVVLNWSLTEYQKGPKSLAAQEIKQKRMQCLFYVCCYIESYVCVCVCTDLHFRESWCSLFILCYLFLLLQPWRAVRAHHCRLLITVALMLISDPLVESCHLDVRSSPHLLSVKIATHSCPLRLRIICEVNINDVITYAQYAVCLTC